MNTYTITIVGNLASFACEGYEETITVDKSLIVDEMQELTAIYTSEGKQVVFKII